MSEDNKPYSNELDELLIELGEQGLIKEEGDCEETIDIVSSVPLSEDEIHNFSFNDEEESDEAESPFPLTEEVFSNGEDVFANAFDEDGLSEEMRRQMMFDSAIHEDSERIVDKSEFADLISDVLSEQEEYMEEYGQFHEVESAVDILEEHFEKERSRELLHVENSVLSIQQEDEVIAEYILCKGIYTEAFKIFIHNSPLIVDGNMPFVIELDDDLILFRRINPEPRVIRHILNTLPNFEFTYVNSDGESEVTPFGFLDKCEFTI